MSHRNIIYIQDENGVATIVLNRPSVLNAVNFQTAEELLNAVRKCGKNSDVKVLIIKGATGAFSSGADLKAMKPELQNIEAFFKRFCHVLHEIIMEIVYLEKPVVASIDGVAAGFSFGLILACDVRLASERSEFSAAQVNLGLTPNGGITYFLPRLVGLGKATELIFTGRMINAEEAKKTGVVNQVFSAGELEKATEEVAAKLASGASLAINAAKKLLKQGLYENLRVQLKREAEAIAKASATVDFEEGLNAFLEKRKPKFKGK
ncbi:MAG: enoyl-CoA hydratase/isomerase family protein [Thermoproteota archaeon]|nr:enoyl-CoA hydratase/isomerase family protein [Thermoproteota archaeon]